MSNSEDLYNKLKVGNYIRYEFIAGEYAYYKITKLNINTGDGRLYYICDSNNMLSDETDDFAINLFTTITLDTVEVLTLDELRIEML